MLPAVSVVNQRMVVVSIGRLDRRQQMYFRLRRAPGNLTAALWPSTEKLRD
jgi:hypothetical protein